MKKRQGVNSGYPSSGFGLVCAVCRRLCSRRGGGKERLQPCDLMRLDGQEMHTAIRAARPPHCGKVDQNREVIRGDLEAEREVGIHWQVPSGFDPTAFQGEIQESSFAGRCGIRGERHAVMNCHGHMMPCILGCGE